MLKKICNLWLKHKTKNYTEIPLFCVLFNYQKYKQFGEKNSCLFSFANPELYEDMVLREKIGEVIEHIRENYDMEKFKEI